MHIHAVVFLVATVDTVVIVGVPTRSTQWLLFMFQAHPTQTTCLRMGS